MRPDKLSASAAEAFQASMGIAADAEASIIEPIHLLAAILDTSENNVDAILKRAGANPTELKQLTQQAIANKPKISGAGAPMAMPGNDMLRVMDRAEKIADKMGDSFTTTEHLLIALADDKGMSLPDFTEEDDEPEN